MKVYVAGHMTGRPKREVLDQRFIVRRLLEEHGHEVVDPADKEAKYFKGKIIPNDTPEAIMRRIYKDDMSDMFYCDALLVLTGDTPTDGTWHELVEADKAGKHIVLIAPKRVRKELITFATILYPCVETMEEAVGYLTDMEAIGEKNLKHDC